MNPTVLTIDVGNTATNFGLFVVSPLAHRPKPFHLWTVSTSQIKKGPTFKSLLRKKFSSQKESLAGVVVSSVVPAVDQPLSAAIHSSLNKRAHFVTAQTKTKVKILYRHPAEVGADRIVNARAAHEICNGPAVVVDFGTATTFDCVTARGDYLGGVIAPGPLISAEALYQKTAKLPLVNLDEPADILGRTTLESIKSGLYHGYRGLVKEIVMRLKIKMGAQTSILSTGGQAHWILKGLGIIDKNIPHLTLMGLYFVWQDLKSEK